MRFRVKMTICMIWLLSLAFGVGGSLLISISFNNSIEREKEAALNSFQYVLRTLQLVNEVSTLPNNSDILDVIQQMESKGMNDFSAISLSEHGGETLYSSGSGGLAQLGGAASNSLTLVSDDAGNRHFKVAGTIETEAQALQLIICYDIQDIYTARDEQYSVYATAFAVTIAVGAALSYLLAYLLTRPLGRLSAATKRIAAGDLSYRRRVKTNDEFGTLSENFDAMAEKLEENITELKDSVRRQEEFMGSFAHEMKTPMTSIIGYADLLRSRSLSPTEQMNAANYIFSEGKRLESLSLKLLDMIVLKNSKLELKLTSPSTLISSTVEYLKPIYAEAGIRLQYKCEEGECLMEPDLVKSLLVNLMDNARKALDKGGNIYIMSVMLSDGCEIRVLDNGPGIPPEALAHLTEAFYRVDKSRSRAQGGAGLGLSLCNDIAKLHGGCLKFQSRVGNGTQVTAELHGGRI